MATLAQSHEIVIVVRAAVCNRQHVVHFLGGRESAFFLTLLTQRMLLDIARTDSPPSTSVSLVRIRIALIFVVMALGDLLMLIAVPSVGQSTTTGVGAGALRFFRHRSLL